GADRCYVKKEETQYEISIRIHSNLVYDVYVPLTADSTKNNKKKNGKTASVTKKNLNNGSKDDTPIEVTITENHEKNGIEIRFSRRPDEHILQMVSEKKFRWSKRGQYWYAKRTEERLSFAKEIKDLFEDTKQDLGMKEEVKKEIPKVVITNNVIDATALFAKRAAV
ncbi:hypothetical protein CON36_33120, partial [Bacillus cereus]